MAQFCPRLIKKALWNVRHSLYLCGGDLYTYVCSSPGCDHSESLGGAGYCSGAAQVGLKGGIPETK
jgi:hypothetical protein